MHIRSLPTGQIRIVLHSAACDPNSPLTEAQRRAYLKKLTSKHEYWEPKVAMWLPKEVQALQAWYETLQPSQAEVAQMLEHGVEVIMFEEPDAAELAGTRRQA
jgi:hypothetical protein